DPFGGFGAGGFEDIFDAFGDLFGGGRGRRTGPARGADLRYDLELDFKEAVFGVEKSLRVPRTEVCDHCHGNQAEPGTPIKSCQQCNGTGELRQVRQTPLGRFVNVSACPRCRGEGKTYETACRECNGRGVVQRTRTLDVKIPAGVDDGARVRIAGGGEAGERGGPTGDLYVFLRVRPHEIFSRDGNDLTCEVPISFTQAALGAEIDVPTLEGKGSLKIPEGTQTGTQFRLRSQGVPSVRGFGRGDLRVRVKVVTPTRLSAEQRELLRQLGGGAEPETPGREGEKGLFDRMRGAFKGHG
ncbi:MAG TPA: molecular chaperone DnaJ, partial [Limnochordia bacterium]|nr:molecular chaperone DnaJ [Limnochordia bacterium]